MCLQGMELYRYTPAWRDKETGECMNKLIEQEAFVDPMGSQGANLLFNVALTKRKAANSHLLKGMTGKIKMFRYRFTGTN